MILRWKFTKRTRVSRCKWWRKPSIVVVTHRSICCSRTIANNLCNVKRKSKCCSTKDEIARITKNFFFIVFFTRWCSGTTKVKNRRFDRFGTTKTVESNRILVDLNEIVASDAVRHVQKFASAFRRRAFAPFFTLYQSLPYRCQSLVNIFIDPVRKQVLRALIWRYDDEEENSISSFLSFSFSPSLPVEFFTKLCSSSPDELKSFGVVMSEDATSIDCKTSRTSFDQPWKIKRKQICSTCSLTQFAPLVNLSCFLAESRAFEPICCWHWFIIEEWKEEKKDFVVFFF